MNKCEICKGYVLPCKMIFFTVHKCNYYICVHNMLVKQSMNEQYLSVKRLSKELWVQYKATSCKM